MTMHHRKNRKHAGFTLKCNDANGEVNDATFSCDQARVFRTIRPRSRTGPTPSRRWHDPMENEVLIVMIFVSAGVLSYVVILGLLIIWDRALDHMGTTGEDRVQQGK